MTNAEWTAKTGHVQAECKNPECTGCVACQLSYCSICGGLEGSLLPTCSGRMLSLEEDQENYVHYCRKTGPFAPLT